METADRIEGSIARVEDQYTVIINRGSEHGVEDGMIFAVMAEDVDPIIDPETDEVIGQLPREKLRVKVFEVHPKYSRAQTFRTFVRPGISFTGLSALAAENSMNELFRRQMADTNRELAERFSEHGGIGSISAALSADLAKPQHVRQKIANAEAPTEAEEQPVRAEVTVNIGDKVQQVVPEHRPARQG
jgi:cell shape-determining protein MreC